MLFFFFITALPPSNFYQLVACKLRAKLLVFLLVSYTQNFVAHKGKHAFIQSNEFIASFINILRVESKKNSFIPVTMTPIVSVTYNSNQCSQTSLYRPTPFLGGSAHLSLLSEAFSLEEEGVGCHGMCQHPQSFPGEADAADDGFFFLLEETVNFYTFAQELTLPWYITPGYI